jgi:hypothetical protein
MKNQSGLTWSGLDSMIYDRRGEHANHYTTDMVSRVGWLLLETLTLEVDIVQKKQADLIIISLKINLFLPWYRWKIADLALSNNHSLAQNRMSSMMYCLTADLLCKSNVYKADWNKSADRHVTPLRHNILIPSQPVFALFP